MRTSRFTSILGVASLLVTSVTAQFGVKKKESTSGLASKLLNQQEGLDLSDMQQLMKDPELAEAIEMFTQMNPEEMKEIMDDMMGLFGDDEDASSAIRVVIKEVENMDATDLRETMKEMMEEEEVAKAMQNTMQMLATADESMLDEILGKKDLILESVIQSGQLSELDVQKFRSDPDAWEKELKHIWAELRKQAL